MDLQTKALHAGYEKDSQGTQFQFIKQRLMSFVM
jgi:hypothetical protein